MSNKAANRVLYLNGHGSFPFFSCRFLLYRHYTIPIFNVNQNLSLQFRKFSPKNLHISQIFIVVWHTICYTIKGVFSFPPEKSKSSQKRAGGPKIVGTPIYNWPVY
jgi:hypothetical protein